MPGVSAGREANGSDTAAADVTGTGVKVPQQPGVVVEYPPVTSITDALTEAPPPASAAEALVELTASPQPLNTTDAPEPA